MQGDAGLVSVGLSAIAAAAGVLLARRRRLRRHERTGGLERPEEVRWNAFLLGLIVIPVFIVLVLHVVL